jgi:hypothetical protein
MATTIQGKLEKVHPTNPHDFGGHNILVHFNRQVEINDEPRWLVESVELVH